MATTCFYFCFQAWLRCRMSLKSQSLFFADGNHLTGDVILCRRPPDPGAQNPLLRVCAIMGDFSIHISANLVNQLTEDAEKLKKKTKKTKTKKLRDPEQPQTKVNQKKILDDSQSQKGTVAPGWPLQPPLLMPVPPPAHSAELNAIRSVLQESEKVLEKLHQQEENMVQEVTERAKILRDQEFKLPYPKPLPCLAEKDACEACYKDFAKDPLKCVHVLRNYADCSRRARQQVSAADK